LTTGPKEKGNTLFQTEEKHRKKSIILMVLNGVWMVQGSWIGTSISLDNNLRISAGVIFT